MSEEARRKQTDQRTAHLDERPLLDATDLGNLGLEGADIGKLLECSTRISEAELHERWPLLEHRGHNTDWHEGGPQ
jgi:hypothetical protein